MDKKAYFLKIFRLAEKKYGPSSERLAADDWPEEFQTLIATILSAQTRDETTIPVAEALFKRYPTLEKLSKAKNDEVLSIVRKVNFSPRKSKYIIETAKILVSEYKSKVPDNIDELVKLPGVGRKTANLVITEVHNKDGLTIDTHVFSICNILGFAKAKNPTQTEMQLKEYVPRKYWSRINRLFVLWGKEVPRKTKKKLLEKLK